VHSVWASLGLLLFATVVYAAPIYLTLLFGTHQPPPDRPFGSSESPEPDLPPAGGRKLDVEQLIHEIGEFLRSESILQARR
jgi:hypothetical protein